jgi:nucleotide-binding universal stress UspA family protein
VSQDIISRSGQPGIWSTASEESQKVGIFPTKILLAVDGSKVTEVATRKAVDLAENTGSELHVVYVGQLPNFLMKDPDILGFNRKLYDEIEQESQEVLRKLTWRVKVAGGTVTGAHLRMGSVAEEIIGLAEELGADLIVTGSRGHTGVRRTIVGSISDLVVRHACCPVMVVRALKGEEHKGFWGRIFSSRSASIG